jgi:hypothetical protein
MLRVNEANSVHGESIARDFIVEVQTPGFSVTNTSGIKLNLGEARLYLLLNVAHALA